MTSHDARFVDIHGVRTRVLCGGSGPPLVYLHGAGGTGLWFPHLAQLAERFAVYAPESPGWGGSDDADWMDTIQDYVLHHDGVIRALDLERPVLVGHSLGGWIAAELAVTYPDRLAALVLVDAAGMPIDQEPVPDFFAMVGRGGDEFARMVFEKMDVAATLFPTTPTFEDKLRIYRELTATARLVWHTWFDDKLPRRLARVATPTLVVWGAHERLFPVALAHKYAQAIRGARLELFDDCGHMLPFESPSELARTIAAFYGAEGTR